LSQTEQARLIASMTAAFRTGRIDAGLEEAAQSLGGLNKGSEMRRVLQQAMEAAWPQTGVSAAAGSAPTPSTGFGVSDKPTSDVRFAPDRPARSSQHEEAIAEAHSHRSWVDISYKKLHRSSSQTFIGPAILAVVMVVLVVGLLVYALL
jgi:hypothetical protein